VPGKLPKKAAEALKKLGHPVPDESVSGLGTPPVAAPRLDLATTARIERTMEAGLTAENAARYTRAGRLYALAHKIDPADPVPLRYLGELYRHHTGDWKAARRTFDQILAMPADPVSRAVALHGLGKMTIHEGDFARGVALIEQSVATFPLPLAYRNLAVYWNSEGQVEKAQGFAEKALALDPDDPYTQIFVAAFIAEDGRRDEALRIAHAHEDLLAASYNLAAIQCLLGHRDEALALLRRHFYEYERFDAVRSKEMKEAREDIVFTALKEDPGFVELTAKAEKPATVGNIRSGAAMPGAKAVNP
jgi:tetratricopeptide (TPR) repeat protein